jgi:two-component system, chemotaxis family, CheB/CheR fusion protein
VAESDHQPAGTVVDEGLEALLEHLKATRGFDFTGYKRPSLQRRIDRRMREVDVDEYEDYVDYLEVHPGEFVALFNTILINVTRFFRDPESWERLRRTVIDRIVAARQRSNQPIRVWCAACSSGQEAYTLAIVFAETLGTDEFRARVKIYGTDVDEEDLEQARHALYSADELADVPTELREKYFARVSDERWQFRGDLRRSVIFGRHDLVQDAPISRLDLLTCRNTLMYFNAEVQSNILERFHFALNDGAYLFLGKAETLLSHTRLFEPVDVKHRIFERVLRDDLRPRVGITRRREFGTTPLHHEHGEAVMRAFDSGPIPHLVLDGGRMLIAANDAARAVFGLRPADLGRPVQDLEVSYRPIDLRSMIDRAVEEDRVVAAEDVEWTRGIEDTRFFDIDVTPLRDEDRVIVGMSVTFADVTGHHVLEDDLRAANRDLESAYEELQSTNEELETTNEELQSTVEELETTNEELQSSNEELETINEELQSSNEELERTNEMLHERTAELNATNAYLHSILRGMSGAVVVLDEELTVQIWSHSAEEFWGLRSDEVHGQSFFDLDIGLPVDELRPVMDATLDDLSDFEQVDLTGHDRRGHEMSASVRITPLMGPTDDTAGVIVLVERRETDAGDP